MILTQGEKMVWAASFVSGLDYVRKGGRDDDSPHAIAWACARAARVVGLMRDAKEIVALPVCEKLKGPDDEAMLRAMLGDEARTVPPDRPKPPPANFIKEGQSRPMGDEG